MESIGVDRINTLSQLAKMLDKVTKEHENFDSRFSTDMTTTEVAAHLISVFGRDTLCWGELYPDGELKFFALVELIDEETAYWHLLHSNVRFRYKTKQIVENVKSLLRARGYKEIISKTRRTTPSYKRWMAKLGSHQFEITYKCEL